MPVHDIAQYQAYRLYSDVSFSPDGAWIAYATTRVQNGAHATILQQAVLPGADGLSAAPLELALERPGTQWGAAWSPDGARILTTAFRLGTTSIHLHESPPHRGWLYPLPGDASPETRHHLGGTPFTADGRRIVYRAFSPVEGADPPREATVIAVRDVRSGETATLVPDAAPYVPHSWSPDGTSILLWQLVTRDEHRLWLCDAATGALRSLTPSGGPSRFEPVAWTPDSTRLWLRTDHGRDFLGLALLGVRDRSLTWVEAPEWDVECAAVSADGRYRAWVTNEDGYSRLAVRDRRAGTTRRLASLPDGHISSIALSPSTPVLVANLRRTVRPPDLWGVDVAADHAWRLTRGFVGGVSEDAIAEPELVRYPSFDARPIPAYLYKPRGLAPGARAPVVLWLHGGIEQIRPAYQPEGLIPALTERGIGVLTPNVRGSTGYGNAYMRLLWRDWGGGDLRDVEHAARYLRALPWVDGARLGVVGHSFGGFLVLSCLARLPEYWAVGVDIAGPSDLLTSVAGKPPELRRLYDRFVGHPERDAGLLRDRSPIHAADAIRAPLLVVHGSRDRAVAPDQSDALVERLRALGRTVEHLVLDGSGHDYGDLTPAHRALAYGTVLDWLRRHLAA